MKIKACTSLVAAAVLAGCIPMPGTVMNVGSDSTTETPDTQTNSKNQAPVFHVTISPNLIITGRDGTLSGIVEEEAEEIIENVLSVDPDSTLLLKTDDVEKTIPSKQFDGPLNKGDEPTLIGPQWGGATVDQFNMAQCSKVVEEHRVEPVDPVWEGCRVYWGE